MNEAVTVKLVLQPFGNREGEQTVMVEFPTMPLRGDDLILGDSIDGKVSEVAYNVLERLTVVRVYAWRCSPELALLRDKIEAAEKERKSKIASGYQLSVKTTEDANR